MADSTGLKRSRLLLLPLVAALVVAGVYRVGPSATADVIAVTGSAYGYFSRVSVIGGPPSDRGPTPVVTLAPDASNSPQVASAGSGLAQYGPATLFSSGPIEVSTEGATGAGGSVTSSADIQNVNTSGQEVFTADAVSSTCTASETGFSGSTTVTNGTLQTSEGDPDVVGDEVIVMIPTTPDPNTSYEGQIVGDRFRYVFNEQIVNPDGSITVNAAHLYLLGPIAVGDLIVGQVVCGVTAPVATTTTTTGNNCRPGHGFGDKNHCHTGPPGQERKNKA